MGVVTSSSREMELKTREENERERIKCKQKFFNYNKFFLNYFQLYREI